MDMMGQKMVMKIGDEEKEIQQDPKITYMEQIKEIAGYKCKKAQVIIGENEPITVYYTEEIPVAITGQIKGLKGYPLEYETSQNGLKAVFTAKNVKRELVADSLFVVPPDYKEVTKEEIQKMFGGGK